jgi:toluene monooxygenase system ferredoxin subunit
MAPTRVCTERQLGIGEMLEVEVDGQQVLLIRLSEGEVRAYAGLCPHENVPLAYGEFDGDELTCSAHRWTFDARSGECTDPGGCRLTSYPLEVKDGEIYVAVE